MSLVVAKVGLPAAVHLGSSAKEEKWLKSTGDIG